MGRGDEIRTRTRRRLLLHAGAGMVAGLLAFALLSALERPLREEALARLRLETHTAASVPRVRLEQELASVLALTRGLSSLFAIEGLPDEERFARIAGYTLRGNRHVRHIGVSEGSVVRLIHPRAGNEALIGLDLRAVPDQARMVEKAISTGQPVLAGPVALLQGGTALIQRKPIVAAGDVEWSGTFLGLINMVVNVGSILEAAGLTAPDLPLRFALRGRDGAGEAGQMIWGDPSLFDADPVLLPVALPGEGEWQLAAVPRAGWTVASPVFQVLRGLEVVASLLVAVGLFGLLRHRADRREAVERLRAGEARLRDAQRIGGLGAFEWDIGGGETWWSDELYALYGLEPGSPVPLERILAVVHPDDLADLRAAIARVVDGGGRLNHEHRIIRPDGAVRTVRSWAEVPGPGEGGRRRMRGIVLDVTERAAADAERERLVASLRRSNQELERFAAIASHDLQEPLRQIASPLQLLQRRYQGRLDADAETFIGYAVEGAKRMQRQILDLLEYSRAGAASPGEPVDLGAVVAEARARLAEEETAARAIVEVGPLPTVPGDRDLLTLLFQHLLGNALRYRRPDAAAEIAVAARAEDDGWHITVRDTGIGVAPEYHDRVFEIFRRLAPPDGTASGIGLPLCRRIVEAHGGRIWMESDTDQGATVHVTLPAAPIAPTCGVGKTDTVEVA